MRVLWVEEEAEKVKKGGGENKSLKIDDEEIVKLALLD